MTRWRDVTPRGCLSCLYLCDHVLDLPSHSSNLNDLVFVVVRTRDVLAGLRAALPALITFQHAGGNKRWQKG